jgi:hypothetical protein
MMKENEMLEADSLNDFGLSRIASQLGKSEALKLYWDGAAKEEEGDAIGAVALYKRAFRIWPALDSVTFGGLPIGVREEAELAGIRCQLDIIDVAKSRDSKVILSPKLFGPSDLKTIDQVLNNIYKNETVFENNPENVTHQHKECTFLNNPPHYPITTEAPDIIAKLLSFAQEAWITGNWSGDNESPGPLYALQGGVSNLSIRVIEHWKYSIGGGLIDPLHYDVDSILTIVVLLSNATDFDGGIFRTFESDNITHQEYQMEQGDALCFVSHKFHNIVPITRGIRRSLVMELWQGESGHEGR